MKTVNLKSAWVALKLAALAVMPLTASNSDAGVIGSFTIVGTSQAVPVSATAVFNVVNSTTITVTLTNTTPYTNAAAQLFTGVDFNLANGATTLSGLSLSSQTGQLIDLDANGDYSLLGTTTNWSLVPTTLGGKAVNQLSFDAPQQGIVGPPSGNNNIAGTTNPDYSNANNGFLTNKSHDPLILETATFTITGTNFSNSTTVKDITFLFNTDRGTLFTPVPEPTSVLVFGLGLGVACLTVRLPRRRK